MGGVATCVLEEKPAKAAHVNVRQERKIVMAPAQRSMIQNTAGVAETSVVPTKSASTKSARLSAKMERPTAMVHVKTSNLTRITAALVEKNATQAVLMERVYPLHKSTFRRSISTLSVLS